MFGTTLDAVKRLTIWEVHFETTGTPHLIKRAVMLFKLSFFSKTCIKQPTFSLDFVPKKSVSTLQLWPLSCFRSHHKSENKTAATLFLFYISTCRNSTCWHRACFCPTLPFILAKICSLSLARDFQN